MMTVSFDSSFTLEGTSSLLAAFPDSIPSPNNEIHPPVLFSSAQQVTSRSNNCPIKIEMSDMQKANCYQTDLPGLSGQDAFTLMQLTEG